ncbi:hypothetical protein NBRC110019_10450 [Neptunitalea chrysea]|uniref:Secretion system C-terminal sorting domain-containing protein n=2 Tax=Neptunitalea chrysea TaxID=1647581 RepID=A0A9W6B3K4_9FLAO|nr:hypothetical protein NBRC110019_10450 [Neptunitalea chrysea]
MGAADDKEAVFEIQVDSNNNIYTLSTVGGAALDIAGVSKAFYGASNTNPDYALSSFSCDGTYRWSKIIGGGGNEFIKGFEIDGNNNTYVAGKFMSCYLNNTSPPRIDDDWINEQNTIPIDCRLNFLVKYDENGVFQWMENPQDMNEPSNNMLSLDLIVLDDGTIYWLVGINFAGTFADGAFTYTGTDRGIFIFKYDANGNYIDATELDIDVSDGGFYNDMLFYRNPNNGYFYITSRKNNPNETMSIEGQSVTGSTVIACFDTTGQLQFIKQNTATDPNLLYIHKLIFDDQNDMYIAGKTIGYSMDSFLGMSISESIIPSFILKTDAATANTTYWSTHNYSIAANFGDLMLDTNQNQLIYAGLCGYTGPYVWGSQTAYPNNPLGNFPLLGTFDPITGDCTGLHYMNGSTGQNDYARAIAIDNSGDYLLGGNFGYMLEDANNNNIYFIGGDSDFFIAKYATQACTPMANQTLQKNTIELYPNPTTDLVTLTLKQEATYTLVTLQGALLQKGALNNTNNTVKLNSYPKGMYLLTLTTANGHTQTHKIIKQ